MEPAIRRDWRFAQIEALLDLPGPMFQAQALCRAGLDPHRVRLLSVTTGAHLDLGVEPGIWAQRETPGAG